MQRSLLTAVFVIGCSAALLNLRAQTITDRIKDPTRKGGTPATTGVLGDALPLSLEELTRGSDLILEGRLQLLKTYVNAADTAVITDYAIQPIDVRR